MSITMMNYSKKRTLLWILMHVYYKEMFIAMYALLL